MEELGKKIDKLSNQVTDLRMELWTKHVVFSWKWGLLVMICLASILVLIVLIKRESILQTVAYLGVIYVMNKNLDDVGTALDWYDYRIQLEPIIPTMLPANLFIFPISLSLLYQTFMRWKSFIIALVSFSLFSAYIALPILKYLEIYTTKTWNSHYSFISLIIMASLSKLIIDRLKAIQDKHR
ncbi:CBO0543 family protein [Cytobacillus sp. FJAT-54145]|uniref:CBO0543 family protein n=1 Tax=Cytobacillus spartinae TaxID=3299023 RepID=A0ABW6KBB8_9BACI